MPHTNATINPSCRRKRLQARIGKIRVSRLQSCSKTLRNPYLSDRSSCDSPQNGRPCSTAGYLEEVCLLHDAQKLLLVHLAVAITIGFVNHFLKFFIGHPLAKLLCNSLQILERDLPSLIVIEQAEGLQDLILRVTVQDLVRHHLQELLITDRPRAVIIYVRNHLLDLLLLRLESQSAHGYFELFGVDLATSVRIEEIESFLDFLLLLLCQLLLLLTSRIESPQCHPEKATRPN